MYKIANDAAPDIRIIRKELPASLAAVTARAMQKLPESRYQEGGQMAADLRAVLRELSAGADAVAAAASATAQMPPGPGSVASPSVYDRTQTLNADGQASANDHR
jgi:eukaryotic-like serine/threonine-protein kinase